MSRFLAIAAMLLFASPTWTQTPNRPAEPPRLDSYGESAAWPGAKRLRRHGVHGPISARIRRRYGVHAGRQVAGRAGFGSSRLPGRGDGKPLRTIPMSPLGNHRSLGLTRDGQLVAVRPDNDSVVVYEMSTGKERFKKKIEHAIPRRRDLRPLTNTRLARTTDVNTLGPAIGERDRPMAWGRKTLRFSPDGKWLDQAVDRVADECLFPSRLRRKDRARLLCKSRSRTPVPNSEACPDSDSCPGASRCWSPGITDSRSTT